MANPVDALNRQLADTAMHWGAAVKAERAGRLAAEAKLAAMADRFAFLDGEARRHGFADGDALVERLAEIIARDNMIDAILDGERGEDAA